MQTTKPTPEYIEEAIARSASEVAQLAARFASRHGDRLAIARLTPIEQAAFQLQLDEEALQQWRANIGRLAQALQSSQPGAPAS